jgi:hypothetical protein
MLRTSTVLIVSMVLVAWLPTHGHDDAAAQPFLVLQQADPLSADKRDDITGELTRDQVRAAPEYKEDQPIVVLGASGQLQPLGVSPEGK